MTSVKPPAVTMSVRAPPRHPSGGTSLADDESLQGRVSDGKLEETVTSATALADAMFEVMDQLGEVEGSG